MRIVFRRFVRSNESEATKQASLRRLSAELYSGTLLATGADGNVNFNDTKRLSNFRPSVLVGRMKSNLRLLPVIIALSSSFFVVASAPAASVGKQRIGLQLYSLRNQFAKDVPGTLDEVKSWGIKNVELAGTYGLTTEQFKEQLDQRGLKAVSAHYSFDQFRTNLDVIIRDAKILGLKYAGCAWIPHEGDFDEKTCRDAIEVFNHAGETLAKQGITFFSHTHGYEFQPYKDGTLFDLLMAETKPKYVSFEMDIFWVVHAGQDPVKLLEKYGHRWQLLHLKGMKESTPTGLLTGHSDVTNDAPVGEGKIPFPPLLRAAKKAGAKWYIIEDESPTSEQQIPQSLKYLETLKF
jgi:sugar phosphate isomerase/epimerase